MDGAFEDKVKIY